MKYLIVGLGNIGAEYVNTRHNMGFNIVDALALASRVEFASDRYGAVAQAKWKGRTLVLLKPSTFMNLSGKAVRYWLDHENIDKSNMIVAVDDIALPLGSMRIRQSGSAGGHNGLKNIDELTGGNNYARLRMGVGNDFPKGMQVDFVLSKFDTQERESLVEPVNQAIEAIRAFVTVGIEKTMNMYNKKGVGTSTKQ